MKKTEKDEEEESEENPNENKRKKLEKQIKSQNKILKAVFIVIVSFGVLFTLSAFVVNSFRHFDYRGIEFNKEKFCDAKPCLIFYRTSIPVSYRSPATGKVVSTDYNFYLRNDPRELEEKVPIVGGDIIFKENMVWSLTTEELFCDGEWNLGLQNSLNLYRLLDLNFLVRNQTAEYKPIDEYMFITIQKGDTTSIKKVDENTYEMNINNCEVLPVFERLMIEAFIKYGEVNN